MCIRIVISNSLVESERSQTELWTR